MGKQEEHLRRLITRNGSVSEFSQKSGIPRTSIYNWLKNADTMPASALRSVAKTLGIPADEILMCDWKTTEHIEVCTNEEHELLQAIRGNGLVEVCTEEEAALLKVYRENEVIHGLINKMIT